MERSAAESRAIDDGHAVPVEIYSTLTLDLKSIGSVFGQPGTFARRLSVQRAATMGPQTNICQVIIKNTHTLRDNGASQLSLSPSMSRSQSLLSTNRIPVLAPKRSDRVRLEHALADIWTRELLPYPGMGGVRGDHLIKASASSVMRKLSMASLTSSFTKRSASHASVSPSKANEPGKDLGDVAEKSDHDESGTGLAARISSGRKIASLGSIPPVLPPPRRSSANSTKRLKSNRLLKNPKLSDSVHADSYKLTEAKVVEDTKQKKTKTRWNARLGWSRRRPKTYAGCMGEQS